MTKTTTVASKAFVAVVAAAMVFSLVAPAAKAATAEELQAQIAALMAQITALQGGSTTTTTTTTSSTGMYTFTRALTMGSTGADVTALQNFLISKGHTIAAGATGYFGAQTAAAVAAWQSANGVSPAAGYFGPVSQAKYAAMMAVTTPTTPGTGTGTSTDDGDDTDSSDLSGEASLDTAELNDGESTIEEGDEDQVIGEFEVEFTDGDASISRLDISLDGGTSANPWDAFDTIKLMVDGKEVADISASDKDDYLDENSGELRFSGLDIIAMEDEKLTIEIAASVQNNLDTTELTNWNLEVTSMRFFDADGVATTEADPANGDTASFDIDVAGADEELKLSLADSNPDATDIVVDTDNDTNEVTIMAADLEAKDNDIDVNTVIVKVETTNGSTTDVLDSVRVVIDGQEFDAEAIGTESDFNAAANGAGTGLSEGYSERANATTTVWYFFDIDGDVTIDADDTVEMNVVADFNDTNDGARYGNGVKIKASVTSVELGAWDAEGSDDLLSGQFKGSAVGDLHTLVAEGILVPVDGFTSKTTTQGQDDTTGVFTLEFEVTAVENDFYITDNATTSTTVTNGVVYSVTGGSAATLTQSLTSTADEDTVGVFTVREGETETFTLVVNATVAASASLRVQLDEIWFSDLTTGLSGEAYLPTPVSDYRTSPQSINN